MAKKVTLAELKKMIAKLNSLKLNRKCLLEEIGQEKLKVTGTFSDLSDSEKVPKALEAFHNRLFDQVEGEGPEEEEPEEEEPEEEDDDKKPRRRRRRGKGKAKPKERKVEISREEAVGKAFLKGGDVEKIAEAADALYEKAGGKSNVKQSKKLVQRAVKYFKAIEILEEDSKGKLSLDI